MRFPGGTLAGAADAPEEAGAGVLAAGRRASGPGSRAPWLVCPAAGLLAHWHFHWIYYVDALLYIALAATLPLASPPSAKAGPPELHEAEPA